MRRSIELSHQDALDIVEIIRRQVEKREGAVAIAVCDRHGELHAYLRMDGTTMSASQLAMNKAFTAAREENDTKNLGELFNANGWPVTNLGDRRFLSWPGGVPIVVEGQAIGAVGVSGLAMPDDDELAHLGAAVVADRQPE